MYIAFSGHNDCEANQIEFDLIAETYPGAIWVHGGTTGFDNQVESYAQVHHIPTHHIHPNYLKFSRKAASLERYKEIVDMSDLVVALYDGRKKGGTFFMIHYAGDQGKPVQLIPPCSSSISSSKYSVQTTSEITVSKVV